MGCTIKLVGTAALSEGKDKLAVFVSPVKACRVLCPIPLWLCDGGRGCSVLRYVSPFGGMDGSVGASHGVDRSVQAFRCPRMVFLRRHVRVLSHRNKFQAIFPAV